MSVQGSSFELYNNVQVWFWSKCLISAESQILRNAVIYKQSVYQTWLMLCQNPAERAFWQRVLVFGACLPSFFINSIRGSVWHIDRDRDMNIYLIAWRLITAIPCVSALPGRANWSSLSWQSHDKCLEGAPHGLTIVSDRVADMRRNTWKDTCIITKHEWNDWTPQFNSPLEVHRHHVYISSAVIVPTPICQWITNFLTDSR